MTILRPYIAGAALAAFLALSVGLWLVFGWWQDAKTENAALDVRLRASEARVTLLRAEMESDREIDAIPDDGLAGVVDCLWLLDGCPR
jgi:hypothetical protein